MQFFCRLGGIRRMLFLDGATPLHGAASQGQLHPTALLGENPSAGVSRHLGRTPRPWGTCGVFYAAPLGTHVILKSTFSSDSVEFEKAFVIYRDDNRTTRNKKTQRVSMWVLLSSAGQS